jgi:hypothetical protein
MTSGAESRQIETVSTLRLNRTQPKRKLLARRLLNRSQRSKRGSSEVSRACSSLLLLSE